ncbi:MAG: hypothetical protein ACR2KX_13670 [Chitinophagaceae bacterium]
MPKVIMRSLKKGTATSFSPLPFAGFFNSNHLKKTNKRNAMLQMNVNLDRKLNKRIRSNCNW